MIAPTVFLRNKARLLLLRNCQRYHSNGGVPGENLPFSINNRYKLTALFVVYVGSGLSAPFLITRHQLLKK